MATMIVAILLGVALTTLASSRASELRLTYEATANLLAADLMSEILQQSYSDPNETSVLGIEPSEVFSPQRRSSFDDVDDYENWTESPVQAADGTTLSQFADYSRKVRVQWASDTDLSATPATDSGIKRITVQVTRGGRVIATLSAVRTEGQRSPLIQAVNSLLE